MIADEDCGAGEGSPSEANEHGNGDSRVRIDAAMLTIARLIGRQMAREASNG